MDGLYSIRDKRQKIESLKERILRLRSAAELGTRKLQFTPGGSPSADKMADTIARIDELERQLVGETCELEQNIETVEYLIDQLPPYQRIIMRLRYIDGLTWRQVARRVAYDERHCKRINKQVLEKMSRNVTP